MTVCEQTDMPARNLVEVNRTLCGHSSLPMCYQFQDRSLGWYCFKISDVISNLSCCCQEKQNCSYFVFPLPYCDHSKEVHRSTWTVLYPYIKQARPNLSSNFSSKVGQQQCTFNFIVSRNYFDVYFPSSIFFLNKSDQACSCSCVKSPLNKLLELWMLFLPISWWTAKSRVWQMAPDIQEGIYP